jgi:hypothetical protein
LPFLEFITNGIIKTKQAIRKMILATRPNLSPFFRLEAIKNTAHKTKRTQPQI